MACPLDYALHLGLTEAGMSMKGIVASDGRPRSTAAQGHRRYHTRLPLPASQGGDRTEEVQVAQQILQSLGIPQFRPAGDRLSWNADAPAAPTSRN